MIIMLKPVSSNIAGLLIEEESLMWIIYKKYTDSKYVRYYSGTDLRGFNIWTTRKEDAEVMSLKRVRKMAKELGGKYCKVM